MTNSEHLLGCPVVDKRICTAVTVRKKSQPKLYCQYVVTGTGVFGDDFIYSIPEIKQ